MMMDLLQELQDYIVPIADPKMRAENPLWSTTALLIICLACHMIQLLGRVQEQLDFLLTRMWGSHQFHPYNTHCQALVKDQRSKLTSEDVAWYSEIILHAEPKGGEPSHPKVQQQSFSVRFFLKVLRLLHSSISQRKKTFLYQIYSCMLTVMIMLTTSHLPYYTFCCNICKVHDQFARLSGI
jgi:hypothetical protein